MDLEEQGAEILGLKVVMVMKTDQRISNPYEMVRCYVPLKKEKLLPFILILGGRLYTRNMAISSEQTEIMECWDLLAPMEEGSQSLNKIW